MSRRAQVALEFLMLTAFAMLLLFGLLIVLSDISSTNVDYRRTLTLQDLGSSIRNELVLASEMESGYHRTINLPLKANGKPYSLELQEGGTGDSYLVITAENYETLYSIPRTTGSIGPGKNLIVKETNITVQHNP